MSKGTFLFHIFADNQATEPSLSSVAFVLSAGKETMKLSIIIPVYNLPDLTKRALDSIPFDEDLEVIVVNDGSIEDMSFLEDDARIRYIAYKPNKSVGYARNFAISKARGDYIYGMDNDDFLLTDNFRKALRRLDGTDIVYVNVQINDGTVWKLEPNNKRIFCAFWTKFIKRDLIGDTRCIEANLLDDYYFNEEIQNKPHTEKYTDILAYHYNYPRVNSLIWKKDNGIL